MRKLLESNKSTWKIKQRGDDINMGLQEMDFGKGLNWFATGISGGMSFCKNSSNICVSLLNA
jgi:hypothetical protein